MNYKGRIVEIERENISIGYLHQGIKGSKQYKYDNNSKFKGGNGTYVKYEESLNRINMKIYVYGLDKCKYIDIRDEILKINNKNVRVSAQLLKKIVNANVGKKVSLKIENGEVLFDYSQLKLLFD